MRPILFSVLLSLLLVACGTTPTPSYRLQQVMPAQPHPGITLTLTGVFASDSQVTLNGQPLTVKSQPDTLQVTLPPDTKAGKHLLRIQPGDLQTTLTVHPIIQKVTFKPNFIELEVLGLGSNSHQVTLDQQPQAMLSSDSPTTLRLQSPQLNAYGDAQYQVCITELCSAPYTINMAAGFATGTVFPAQVPLISNAQKLSASAPVHHSLMLHWTDAQCVQQCTPATLPEPNTREASLLPGWERWTFSDAHVATQVLLALQKLPGIDAVSWDDDLTFHSDRTISPQAPSLSHQWFWALEGLTPTQDQQPGKGVTVAIVDSGVVPHPAFGERLLTGYNFVDASTDTTDHVGHGTHVAGLVGASSVLLSPAPYAQLLPVKVVEKSTQGSVLHLTEGILWAANLLENHENPHPAQILNLSLAPDTVCPEVLVDAVEQVVRQGILVVAATGNGLSAVNCIARIPGVLGVTALSGPLSLYQPAYATSGPGTAITAFGGDMSIDQDGDGHMDGILSTDIAPDGSPTYALREGTSMATPQVTGMAARILSTGLNPSLVRKYLQQHSLDLGVPGMDTRFGSGLVQQKPLNWNATHTYALIYRQGTLIQWVEVDQEGTFRLQNLPPSTELQVRVASDHNQNCVMGEAGEALSAAMTFTVLPRDTITLPPVNLQPANGSTPLQLGCPGEQP